MRTGFSGCARIRTMGESTSTFRRFSNRCALAYSLTVSASKRHERILDGLFCRRRGSLFVCVTFSRPTYGLSIGPDGSDENATGKFPEERLTTVRLSDVESFVVEMSIFERDKDSTLENGSENFDHYGRSDPEIGTIRSGGRAVETKSRYILIVDRKPPGANR